MHFASDFGTADLSVSGALHSRLSDSRQACHFSSGSGSWLEKHRSARCAYFNKGFGKVGLLPSQEAL